MHLRRRSTPGASIEIDLVASPHTYVYMTHFEPLVHPRTPIGTFAIRTPSEPEVALHNTEGTQWRPIGLQATLRKERFDRATLFLRLGLSGVDPFEIFDRINDLDDGPC